MDNLPFLYGIKRDNPLFVLGCAGGYDLPSGSCGTAQRKAGASRQKVIEGHKKGLIAIGTDKNKQKRVDWRKIEAEYVGGSLSMRLIAEKYNVPFGTLNDRAARGKWGQKRREAHKKAIEKAEQKAAEAFADNATIAANIKRKLLERLNRMLDTFPEEDATEIQKYKRAERKIYKLKDLTAMYKDLTADMAQPDEKGNALLESLLTLERRSSDGN